MMIGSYLLDEDGNIVKHLYQWDINQKLIVETDNITIAPKIHFCNKNSEKALVVKSTISDNKIIADIPNSLLREPYTITAYIYLENNESAKTINAINIVLRKRPQPNDYIYVDDVNVIYLTDVLLKVEDLKGELDILKNTVNDISQSGISAEQASANQVPTADGNGNWAWQNQKCETENITDIMIRLEKLEYGTLEISAFTVSPSQAEIGSTQNVILTWNINKTPKSLTLDGVDVLGNTNINKLGINTNTSWTLKAVGANNEVTKKANITFFPKLYYGASEVPTEINSDFLLGLSGSLSSSKAKTFNVNASENQYIWFALPSRYGTPSFKTGGFDGGFLLINTIQHTNSSGYTENYDVYRSDNVGLGNTTVTVS